jgi:hypothetical protein
MVAKKNEVVIQSTKFTSKKNRIIKKITKNINNTKKRNKKTNNKNNNIDL